MTDWTGRNAYLDAPDALVRLVNDGFDYATSSNCMMTYGHIERPIGSAKSAAYEMFGEMRDSTQEETFAAPPTHQSPIGHVLRSHGCSIAIRAHYSSPK